MPWKNYQKNWSLKGKCKPPQTPGDSYTQLQQLMRRVELNFWRAKASCFQCGHATASYNQVRPSFIFQDVRNRNQHSEVVSVISCTGIGTEQSDTKWLKRPDRCGTAARIRREVEMVLVEVWHTWSAKLSHKPSNKGDVRVWSSGPYRGGGGARQCLKRFRFQIFS